MLWMCTMGIVLNNVILSSANIAFIIAENWTFMLDVLFGYTYDSVLAWKGSAIFAMNSMISLVVFFWKKLSMDYLKAF